MPWSRLSLYWGWSSEKIYAYFPGWLMVGGVFFCCLMVDGWFALKKMRLPSLKLTASLHLKMDGWNTFSFPFEMAYLQGRAVSVRECIFRVG